MKGMSEGVLELLLAADEELNQDWTMHGSRLFTVCSSQAASGVLILARSTFRMPGPVTSTMDMMSEVYESHPDQARGFLDKTAGLFALGCIFEGKGLLAKIKDAQQMEQRGLTEEDMADAVPLRAIAAVDLTGQLFYMQRIKGMPVIVREQGEPVGGALLCSLQRLFISLVRQMPDRESELERLQSMFIDTTEEALLRSTLRGEG
jgi:hypothetical protein